MNYRSRNRTDHQVRVIDLKIYFWSSAVDIGRGIGWSNLASTLDFNRYLTRVVWWNGWLLCVTEEGKNIYCIMRSVRSLRPPSRRGGNKLGSGPHSAPAATVSSFAAPRRRWRRPAAAGSVMMIGNCRNLIRLLANYRNTGLYIYVERNINRNFAV